MSNEKQETPVRKIAEILRESGAEVYVVAVASTEGNGRMRALSGMNGSGDDIIQLLASVIRVFVDGMKFPDQKAKKEATMVTMSLLMQAVVEGANEGERSVDPL